jgi:hypothetical protein
MTFDSPSGVQKVEKTVFFASRVKRAEAVLNGFNVSYNNGPKTVLRHFVDLTAKLEQNAVIVTGRLLLRTDPGIDPFVGAIDFVVIAEVE